MVANFEYEGVTVHLKTPTGRTRLYLYHLKDLAGVYDMPNGFDRSSSEQVLYLLSLFDKVEGNPKKQWGFAIPNGDANKANLTAFIDGIQDAPEELFLLWNDAAFKAKTGNSDPDLTPPEDTPKNG